MLKNKKLFQLCFVFFFLFCIFSADAQKTKRKKKIYTVDFQDELVQGHAKNPTIFHLFNKQQLEYEKMVDLRDNFLPEMTRTAEEIE